jgi:DNA helicase-2/ATP-dependent DNA helicase PcrA
LPGRIGQDPRLTHRIAWLLATGRARPNQILAITFTNKAADEMRERVSSLVGGVSRRMWVMTFHAACARLLRIEGERLGYTSRFTIYDEADSLRMLKRCLEELEVDTKRYPPRAVRARISDAKNQLIDAETYQETAGGPFEEMVGQAYRLYERRMLEANSMDFDDLLTRTVNVLELFEDVRRRYRERFRWVLVDEYQDTNHAQYRLLQLLGGEDGNLTVVGDEDQCVLEARQSRWLTELQSQSRRSQSAKRSCPATAAVTSGPQRSSEPVRPKSLAESKFVRPRVGSSPQHTSTPISLAFPSLFVRPRLEMGSSQINL